MGIYFVLYSLSLYEVQSHGKGHSDVRNPPPPFFRFLVLEKIPFHYSYACGRAILPSAGAFFLFKRTTRCKRSCSLSILPDLFPQYNIPTVFCLKTASGSQDLGQDDRKCSPLNTLTFVHTTLSCGRELCLNPIPSSQCSVHKLG